MTIKLSKATTKDEIAELLRKLTSTKKLNVHKYAGKLKWEQDPLTYQRELRDK